MSQSAKYVYTNTSEWLFGKDPLYTFSDNYKKNIQIFNAIFSESDVFYAKRLCFDKCVNDFKSANFSLTEKACMTSCLATAESFLYNLNINLENNA